MVWVSLIIGFSLVMVVVGLLAIGLVVTASGWSEEGEDEYW